VCASQKAGEEGVSERCKIARESKLRVLKIKARVAEQKERRTKKKGALKARTCPTSSKLAHMLLTAAIVTAKFWCGEEKIVWNSEKRKRRTNREKRATEKKGRERHEARINCFEKREIILLCVYTFTLYNNLLSPSL